MRYYVPHAGWIMILLAYPVSGLGLLLIMLSWTPAVFAGATMSEGTSEAEAMAAGMTGAAGFGLFVVVGLLLLHLGPILLFAGVIRVAVEPLMRQNEVLITLQTASKKSAPAPAPIPTVYVPQPPPVAASPHIPANAIAQAVKAVRVNR